MIRLGRHIMIQIVMVTCALWHIVPLLPHHHHYDSSTGRTILHISFYSIAQGNHGGCDCDDCGCTENEYLSEFNCDAEGCHHSCSGCTDHNIELAKVEQQKIETAANPIIPYNIYIYNIFYSAPDYLAYGYDILLFRQYNLGIDFEPLIKEYISSIKSPRGPDGTWLC